MILGTNKTFPPDIRVEKESKALAKAGYNVSILVRRIPEDSPLEEEFIPGHVNIKRAPIAKMGSWARKKMDFTLIETAWFSHLESFINKEKPDILHVHDFYMVPTVLKKAKKYNIPVVADLHENMPAVIVARQSIYPPLKRIKIMIQKNYYLWRWHEARKLRQCEKIIVVVPEASERLKKYGIPENKIVTVSNTEDKSTFKFDPKDADPEIMNRYQKCWFISYIGGIGPHRGLDTLLRAIPVAKLKIPELKLAIVGARGTYLSVILDEIGKNGIGDCVEVIGWQPFEKVNSYMLASKVCLIPHNNFEHTQTTIPHKLFQAMICKRPVLVSSCRPLKRVVEDSNSGCVFRANDSEDLADKLVYMYNHPSEIAQMASNGQKAALGRYSWQHDADRLIEMYSELERSYLHN